MHETSGSAPFTTTRHDTTPAIEAALRALGPAGCEMSLVDVVLLACEVTEDETEVNDVVDTVIRRGAARLLPVGEDAMLRHVPEESADVAA